MCLQTLKMFSSRIFVFALFCVSSIIGEKKLCDINNNQCLTAGAARRYDEFISGMPGVEPSDPLQLDLIEVNLPTVKYKLINGSLSGMGNCHMELLQFSPKDKKYYAHIGCPYLVIKTGYEVKGNLGPEFIEGNGICRMFLFDYNFLFNGDFEKKNCNDTKIHLQLTNTNLEIESKGKVHYDFENLFNGNKAKSDALHKFVNENWQYIDKLLRQPGMEAFMKKYIHNVNAFLRIVPVQDMFFEET